MDRELLLELKAFLAERTVDNMTTEQLAEYVQDDLFTYYDKLGEHEFLEEAENYWGDSLVKLLMKSKTTWNVTLNVNQVIQLDTLNQLRKWHSCFLIFHFFMLEWR